MYNDRPNVVGMPLKDVHSFERVVIENANLEGQGVSREADSTAEMLSDCVHR